MQTINITLPTCWQELTPAQLRYVYYLISAGFTSEEVKTYVIFRWANIEVIAPEGDGFAVKFEGRPERITALQIAELLPHLAWLDRFPAYPVRLPELCGHKAAEADLRDVSLETYLTCDNNYIGYLYTRDSQRLEDMGAWLYGAATDPKFNLSPEERLSIFYWFGAAKELLARRFKNFFKTAPIDRETTNLQQKLQEGVDAQIRALTKGDITKERQVLDMDVWRALTELDAQVVDAEEIKRQLHQS